MAIATEGIDTETPPQEPSKKPPSKTPREILWDKVRTRYGLISQDDQGYQSPRDAV